MSSTSHRSRGGVIEVGLLGMLLGTAYAADSTFNSRDIGRTTMRNIHRWVIAVTVALAASTAIAPVAAALQLQPGDLLVVEGGGCAMPSVIRVDPATGEQDIVSQGDLMFSPSAIFFDSRGDILVSDRNGRLIRIDPTTGSQSLVTLFSSVARGIAEEQSGSLLVIEYPQTLWRVNPNDGSANILSVGGLLSNAFGVATDALGAIYVTNLFSSPDLLSIDPSTGSQRLTYSSAFNSLYGLSVDGDGSLLVAENHQVDNSVADDAIVRVDPATHASNIIWQLGYAVIDVDVDAGGDLIILDQGPGSGCAGLRSSLRRFKRSTAMTTTIVTGGLMADTQSLVIVPGIPIPRCGDGHIQAGEDCDDGNTASGDCCDSTCESEAQGNACDDGNADTTDDSCMDGICVGTPHPNNLAICDDGDPCTLDGRSPVVGCVHGELTGFDRVSCTFRSLPPSLCRSPLPRRIRQTLGRARGLITQASVTVTTKHSRRLVARAVGALEKSATLVLGARRRIPHECAQELVAAIDSARTRAVGWLLQTP